jgi:hypothetical protein
VGGADEVGPQSLGFWAGLQVELVEALLELPVGASDGVGVAESGL